VLLLLGAACLGAEGAIGRRRAACPTVPVVALQPVEDEQPPAKSKAEPTADEAAVRKSTTEFAKAANARDAKAAAALWTEAGEYTDDDGTSVRGRANLEKMYAESFAATPKGKFEVALDSVRMLGKNPRRVRGFAEVHAGRWLARRDYEVLPPCTSARETAGSSPSAKEWMPADADLAKLADLEFLIGDWEAKRDDRELRISYAWGDGKAFIQVRFMVKDKGDVTASGTEILAKDPASGELRAWLFDKSGTIGESVWSKDGKRWVIRCERHAAVGRGHVRDQRADPAGEGTRSRGNRWTVSAGRAAAAERRAPLKVTRVKK